MKCAHVACGGCDLREKAVEVKKIRMNMDILYTEAVKMVQRERRVERREK